MLGALVFGYLTDRLGRKKLFTVTLGLYLVSAHLDVILVELREFRLFSVSYGAAIGGEYSAINSAIDELIPAAFAGWADLAINGTFWLGAAAGSLVSIFLLDLASFPPTWAGAWVSAWGRSSGSRSSSCAIVFPRAHAGCSSTESPTRPSAWSRRSKRRSKAKAARARWPRSRKRSRSGPRPDVGFMELAGVMLKNYPRRTSLGYP